MRAAMFPRKLSFASLDERRKTWSSVQSKFTSDHIELPSLRLVYIFPLLSPAFTFSRFPYSSALSQ